MPPSVEPTGPGPAGTAPAPRVDLHRHLEGSIRPATAVALGQAAGLYPASLTVEAFSAAWQVRAPLPLLTALERFDGFRRPVRGHAAVVRITLEALEDAERDGITHLNVRFSPVTLAAAAGLTLAEVFEAVAEGLVGGRARFPRLCLEPVAVVSRRRGLEAAWQVVRALDAGPTGYVVGADLAADELRVPTAAFRDVAAAFAARGLPLTVHTGEGTGPAAVAEALALPGVRRLGHALSLPDDPHLLHIARQRQILVEVCPTSNVRTGTVGALREHPARRLVAAGLPIAFCTDDPTLFGIDLAHELRVAECDLGLAPETVRQSQHWARAAFFGGPAGT